MSFSVATWNINSVRLRLPLVERFLREYRPDVLCLQETKCPDDLFPLKDFRAFGYEHIAISGQKGYHGVATVSRRPLAGVETVGFCDMGDCRAGGDEPDPAINPKFAHKLAFLEEMRAIEADRRDGLSSLLVGDLNIAPLENDVWSHKQLLKIVSHTPIETETLEDLRVKGGWSDLMRLVVPAEQKIYTWWSYRAKDWDESDRGRRLDHVWGSPDMESHMAGLQVLRDARGWDRPSDHVPVIATFDLD